MTNKKSYYLELNHRIYTLIPSIKILDHNNKLIGYIRIKFFASFRKITYIFNDQSLSDYKYIIKKTGSRYKNVEYLINCVECPEKSFYLRHIGPRIIYKRNNWELVRNSIPFGFIKEVSSNISMIRQYFLVVPYLGTFLDHSFSLTPKKYDVLTPGKDNHQDLEGKFNIYKNFFSINTTLNLESSKSSLNEMEYIGALSVIELLEVINTR